MEISIEHYNRLLERLTELEYRKAEWQWIPCSEELPEKEGRYLCTVGSNHRNPREMIYAPDTWRTTDNNLWRSTDGTYCFNWFVKAWMPLPEPYKKGEQDE